MKVFVIGGTGAVGRHAVRALASAGHEVTGIARSPAKAEQLRSDGGQPVEVSIFDAAALAEAFAGSDTVVNLASAIPPVTKFMSAKAWATNDRVRREGSTAIVDAALSAAVDRVLQESVVMLYPDGGDSWIDETTRRIGSHWPRRTWLPRPTPSGSATRVAPAWCSDSAGSTVRAPPTASSSSPSPDATSAVQMGRPKTYVSSIHVADAGTTVEAALHVPAGTYNIVDDEPLTKHAYADALAAAADARPWLRYPGRSALLLGHRTTSLTRSIRAGNRRFKEAAGWAPSYPSASEGWQAMAAGLTTG